MVKSCMLLALFFFLHINSWTDHVRNEEVLLRVKEQRNILHEIINGRLTGLVTFCVETAF